MRTDHSPVRRRLVAGLVLALASVLVLSGCGSIYDAPLPGGAKVGKDPITVHVRFRDVLDLVPQSTVKVDDVTVGKVTAVKLDGYTADVTVKIKRSTDLPDNATAAIRQTSLLGEKFVSLSAPSDPTADKLANGDVIGLDHSGRNPEVEEVLSALALLLNGGGVAQLKSITSELNKAVGGREGDVRSVLDQLHTLMGELDKNRGTIVTAIDNLDRLAKQLRRQDSTIKLALDDLPAALKSINSQRGDLVKMLSALDQLSGVGVRVISQSKVATTQTLRDLTPVLSKLADAGQDLPNALNALYAYPFIDEAVGRDPQVARNLQMGDYVNLSARLNLDLGKLPTIPGLPGLPGPVCKNLAKVLKQARAALTNAINSVVDPIPVTPIFTQADKNNLKNQLSAQFLDGVLNQAEQQCTSPDPAALAAALAKAVPALLQNVFKLTTDQIKKVLSGVTGPLAPILGRLLKGAKPPAGTPANPLGGLLGQLGLGRAAPNSAFRKDDSDPFRLAARGVDPGLGTLLLQGVADVR